MAAEDPGGPSEPFWWLLLVVGPTVAVTTAVGTTPQRRGTSPVLRAAGVAVLACVFALLLAVPVGLLAILGAMLVFG